MCQSSLRNSFFVVLASKPWGSTSPLEIPSTTSAGSVVAFFSFIMIGVVIRCLHKLSSGVRLLWKRKTCARRSVWVSRDNGQCPASRKHQLLVGSSIPQVSLPQPREILNKQPQFAEGRLTHLLVQLQGASVIRGLSSNPQILDISPYGTIVLCHR